MDALLRLLHLVLNHADVVSMEQLLGSCPAAPWQVLTPQLMGQLMSPGQPAAVKGTLAMLLRAVAGAEPCTVLYPVVLELRVAESHGQEAPEVLLPIMDQLQRQHPQLLADTLAMAAALETLTVTIQVCIETLIMCCHCCTACDVPPPPPSGIVLAPAT
jgi:hypothetical protein